MTAIKTIRLVVHCVLIIMLATLFSGVSLNFNFVIQIENIQANVDGMHVVRVKKNMFHYVRRNDVIYEDKIKIMIRL